MAHVSHSFSDNLSKALCPFKMTFHGYGNALSAPSSENDPDYQHNPPETPGPQASTKSSIHVNLAELFVPTAHGTFSFGGQTASTKRMASNTTTACTSSRRDHCKISPRKDLDYQKTPYPASIGEPRSTSQTSQARDTSRQARNGRPLVCSSQNDDEEVLSSGISIPSPVGSVRRRTNTTSLFESETPTTRESESDFPGTTAQVKGFGGDKDTRNDSTQR
jgi:hypothetical protein